MNFTEEQLAMLSPAEREIAQAGMAATAAGRDPLAEIDAETEPPTEGATPPAPAPAPTPAEPAPAPATAAPSPAPAPAEPAPTPAPAEPTPPAEPGPAEPAAVAPAPLQFSVDPNAAKPLQEKKASLRAEIAKVDQQWADGEITTEERLAKLQPMQDEVDQINGSLAVMQTLQAANQQSIQRSQEAVIADIMQRGNAAGLPYATTKALQSQFNAAMDALEADPANATLTFADLAEKAHQTVLAIHGKLAAAAPAAQAPAPATPPTRTTATPPPTLREMPAAQRPNEGFAGGTVAEQILSGNAIDAEEQWAKLSPAQREALLRG